MEMGFRFRFIRSNEAISFSCWFSGNTCCEIELIFGNIMTLEVEAVRKQHSVVGG